MKGIRDMEIPSDPVVLLQKYQDDLYQIDSYYRWFYRAFDQIEENEKYMQVRERIENIYANDYLLQMVPKWNAIFDEQAESTFDQCGLVRQDRFFSHYLHAYDGKERIIVIISDALRYECAKELMTKLDMYRLLRTVKVMLQKIEPSMRNSHSSRRSICLRISIIL